MKTMLLSPRLKLGMDLDETRVCSYNGRKTAFRETIQGEINLKRAFHIHPFSQMIA
jgi:hypothetical protein